MLGQKPSSLPDVTEPLVVAAKECLWLTAVRTPQQHCAIRSFGSDPFFKYDGVIPAQIDDSFAIQQSHHLEGLNHLRAAPKLGWLVARLARRVRLEDTSAEGGQQLNLVLDSKFLHSPMDGI